MLLWAKPMLLRQYSAFIIAYLLLIRWQQRVWLDTFLKSNTLLINFVLFLLTWRNSLTILLWNCKNIPSLQYLTPTTIRIRFRDEEGDFVNLPVENNEMFNEMLKSGRPIEDRDYIKISLKVSELDLPLPVISPLLRNVETAATAQFTKPGIYSIRQSHNFNQYLLKVMKFQFQRKQLLTVYVLSLTV